MRQSIDSPAGPRHSRRAALAMMGGGAVAWALTGHALAATTGGAEDVLTESAVLRDPEIPSTGNAEGDVTIVEYFDFNCPYCRKLDPELRQVVQDDGKVKLVYK